MRTSQPHPGECGARLCPRIFIPTFLFPSLHFADYTDDRVRIGVHVCAYRIDTHQIDFYPRRLAAARNASILWQEHPWAE